MVSTLIQIKQRYINHANHTLMEIMQIVQNDDGSCFVAWSCKDQNHGKGGVCLVYNGQRHHAHVLCF